MYENSMQFQFKKCKYLPIMLKISIIFFSLPQIENPCAKNPCSDLCLLAPGLNAHLNHSCACPQDKELTENLSTCRYKKSAKSLMAAYKNNVYLTEPKHLGHTTFRKFTLDVESIASMAYDNSKGRKF